MRRIFSLMLILFIILFLAGCDELINRNKCLNYFQFEKFFYNGHLYIQPENFDDLYIKYDFYGTSHKVGYTIGVYRKIFETHVLDCDTEENILFQKKGMYFWLKEGFEFPNSDEMKITKLFIEKMDSKSYVVEEKEFDLDNILFNEILEEYSIDLNRDSFLLNIDNFLKYRIKYIYDDWIISNEYDRFTIYNGNLFIEKINEFDESKIYLVDKKHTANLYDFVLNNFN